jgi:NAD(P)-dependent dehydrogenase (short-subunit alcohol dehydrogenase family)
MLHLEGKVCVVTGAAGTIGGETVAVFKREGATVAAVDLREGAEGADLSLAADLTDEEQVRGVYDQVAERFGRIDVLFNNAGIAAPGDESVLDTDLEVWNRVLAVNLTSVFLCCKHGIPHLLAAGGGSVINTSSLVAAVGSAASQIGYTASKGGVLALSRELGVEFARRGVRVNALLPGPVDTPLLRSLFDAEQSARRLVHVPTGRFADAREIAEAVAFLASDASSYVTATEFLVDGGISAAYVTPEG